MPREQLDIGTSHSLDHFISLTFCTLFPTDVGVGYLPGKKKTRCLLNRARSLALDVQPSNGKYIPKCSNDGRYDPVQCHSALGQCWCVDKYGNELHETRQEGTPDCSDIGKHFRHTKGHVAIN